MSSSKDSSWENDSTGDFHQPMVIYSIHIDGRFLELEMLIFFSLEVIAYSTNSWLNFENIELIHKGKLIHLRPDYTWC